MAAKDTGLVNARWVGYPGNLADGTALIPGETVVAVPKGEAEQSDYWQPVGAGARAPRPKKTAEQKKAEAAAKRAEKAAARKAAQEAKAAQEREVAEAEAAAADAAKQAADAEAAANEAGS